MIKLNEIPTTPPQVINKKDIREQTKDLTKRIGKLQQLMFAEGKQSLLVVLQGMDSSGKDGSTRNVFQRCSPAGISLHAFKKPTDEEFAHDFLWRVHKQAPQRGQIKIFNRSHYEDILIQRVHGWIDQERVNNRIKAINAFEELISFDNHTTILKFYMHISHERQGAKLQERIDDPEKNWKHNPGDWEERKLWKKYMDCYEDAMNRSSIPWTIVPVDERWYRDYFIASKVCATMESLNMKLPVLAKSELTKF